jgi:Xaa-Pro aminopeptidase
MTINPFQPLDRISYIQDKMSDSGIDVICLTYSKSVYYYAGTTQPAILLITPEDYRLMVINGFDFAIEEAWLNPDKVSPCRGVDAKELLKRWKIHSGTLGTELDILPTTSYFKVSKIFPEFRIVDISHLVMEQRKVKDAREVDNIRQACRSVNQGHERILEVLRDGMTELELSAEIEHAHRRAGHEGQYFIRQFDFFMGPGVLASGENLSKIAGRVQSITGVGLSHAIPLGASAKKIKKGEMVVVDIPTYYNGYHSDQSRTYVVGKAPESCRVLYGGMKDIADRVIMNLMPGVICGDIYDMVMKFAVEVNMDSYFMRLGGNPRKLSFVGHGLGLELNEPPLLRKNNQEILEEGNVVTLELEMWKSVGEVVKLEDTLLITSNGAEILTISPRNLREV